LKGLKKEADRQKREREREFQMIVRDEKRKLKAKEGPLSKRVGRKTGKIFGNFKKGFKEGQENEQNN